MAKKTPDKIKENRANTAARLRALWQDPEYREKMRANAKRKAEERMGRSPLRNVTGAQPGPIAVPKPKEPKPEQTPEQAAASEAARAHILVRWADRQAPPENAAEIIAAAAENGCTHGEICKALGIGRPKFKEWLESPVYGPALQAAMAEGKQVEHDRLVGLLMTAATTGTCKGSLVAILFMLKTRHAYIEGAALVQNSVSINYQLPAPLSPEDYMQMVAPGAGQKQHVPATAVRKLLPAVEVTRG
jgi:hypothetical protein